MKRQKNNLLAILFVILLVGSTFGGIYLFTRSCNVSGDDTKYSLDASISDLSDIYNNFNTRVFASGVFTTDFEINQVNEPAYNYAYISLSLPDKSHRYNRFYIEFVTVNVKEVVFVVGATVYKHTAVGDKTLVNFSVGDWGENPKVFIFIDTYGTDLTKAYAASKTLTVYDVGFMF